MPSSGKKGNSGGKPGRSGRKPKFDETELMLLLDKAWPEKAREEAIKNIASRASRGDLEAFRLLMAYCYGKPKEKHELSGKDGKDLIPTLNVIIESSPGSQPPLAIQAGDSLPVEGQ
jgi:hypothetical protein